MMTSESKVSDREIIAGYDIRKKLGQGGMGAVYLAIQKSMDREVALKILPKSLAKKGDFKERFFREARNVGQLNHPNIVTAIDAQESNGYCYLVMEYVDGESVAAKLKREGSLPEEEALGISLQIARGLSHAWKSDLVHRDVKPENFLLTSNGVAKLCDLGIAKSATSEDASLTQAGTALGTPRYIAPEQARGLTDIDYRADIYSLGASLYHMLCGEPPFDGPTAAAIMIKHLSDPLPPISEKAPSASKHTIAVIEKMMAKEPESRYCDQSHLIEDLEALCAGSPPIHASAKRSSTRKVSMANLARKTETIKRASRRQSGSQTGLLVGIVVVVLAALVVILGRSDPNGGVAGAGGENSGEAQAANPDAGKNENTESVGSEPPEDLARIALAEAKELENAGKLDRAAAGYERIISKWPNTDSAAKAAKYMDGIKIAIDQQAAAKNARKRAGEAAAALAKLRERKEKLPELEYERLLQKFRLNWDGTPSADQASSEARILAEEREQRESDAREGILSPELVERSKKVLTGNNEEKIKAILGVLAKGKPNPSLEPLIPEVASLSSKSVKSSVRKDSLEALANISPEQALVQAEKALDDRNDTVRAKAVEVLADAGSKSAVEKLKALVGNDGTSGDPSPLVRNAARKALANLK